MLFRIFTTLASAAALAVYAATIVPSTARANTILAFGQSVTKSEFTATDNGNGTTSISVTGGSIDITALDPNASGLPAGYPLASFSFAGHSTDAATIGAANTLVQNFSGTFAITEGGTNILSGTFTDLLSGSGSGAVLTGSTPPGSNVTFTSAVIPVADLDVERALSLSFSNVVPTIGTFAAPSDNTFPSFTASVTGDFSANNAPPPLSVTEPGTTALLGAGIFGLSMVLRERSKS